MTDKEIIDDMVKTLRVVWAIADTIMEEPTEAPPAHGKLILAICMGTADTLRRHGFELMPSGGKDEE